MNPLVNGGVPDIMTVVVIDRTQFYKHSVAATIIPALGGIPNHDRCKLR